MNSSDQDRSVGSQWQSGITLSCREVSVWMKGSKKVPVTVALPLSWLSRLEQRAQQERKSLSALVRDWVGEHLQEAQESGRVVTVKSDDQVWSSEVDA